MTMAVLNFFQPSAQIVVLSSQEPLHLPNLQLCTYPQSPH